MSVEEKMCFCNSGTLSITLENEKKFLLSLKISKTKITNSLMQFFTHSKWLIKRILTSDVNLPWGL